MATAFVEVPHTTPGKVIYQEVREQIEELFHNLIQQLEERKERLLRQIEQWQEEFNIARAKHSQSLVVMRKERDEIMNCLTKLIRNKARALMEKGIVDLNNEIFEREKKLAYPPVRLVYDKNDLEAKISKLGTLIREKTEDESEIRRGGQKLEFDTKSTLDTKFDLGAKSKFHMKSNILSRQIKVFSGFGRGRGKFLDPRGVAIDNLNERVFIVDSRNSRIQVWSMKGEFLSMFGRDKINGAWAIALFNDHLFITEFCSNTLSKWSLHTFTLVKKYVPLNAGYYRQFNSPTGLDIDKGEIFVIEQQNNRISVFNLNLEFIRIMADKAIAESYCLRVRNDTIYVLERTGIIRLFSRHGQLLKIIPKLPCLQNCYYFCLDSQLNFLISDNTGNTLSLLSPEGDLLDSICLEDFNLEEPYGVDISSDGRIVLCLQSETGPLAIL